MVDKVPAPKADPAKVLRALVFDSWFDIYQGVVVLCRVVDGKVSKGDKIKFMSSDAEYEVLKLGYFTPQPFSVNELSAGEVGFIVCGIKSIRDVQVGDTLTLAKKGAEEPLAGFQKIKPMVFAGIFPVESPDFKELEKWLLKN